MPDLYWLLLGYALGLFSFMLATYTTQRVRSGKPILSMPKRKEAAPVVFHNDELNSRL